MIAPRMHRSRARRLMPAVQALEPRHLLSTDVLTYHNDNARTGTDATETTLTPANVSSTTFGKVGFLAVDGKVDAQPLVKTGVPIPGQGVHDVVYVATENDSVYAFDATSGALLWHDGPSALIPGESPVLATDVNCDQVEPTIGITATPVIDPTTNTMYVVAMSKATVNGQTTFYQRIHALDLGTGADKVAPHSIDGNIAVPGAGPGGNGSVVSFNPKMYKERSALTLSNGVVYTGWSSHCDEPDYTGWIIGFRASDLGLAAVTNVDPNGTPAADNGVGTSGGTFWNSGGGFAVDAAGNLYNITGNGPFDPSAGDYGDSYIKLAGSGTAFRVVDYFTPSNQQALSDQDIDLGSSGVTLLPDATDATGTVRHLMVGSGKDGNIYVLDRDNLGQFNANSNAIVQEIVGGVGGAEFGTPTYFNGTVYFGGVGQPLRAYSFQNGRLSTSPTSTSANSFGYPGSTVAVSANGSADGIVWAAENGTVAALHAYDAANLGDELYNSNQAGTRDQFGQGNKFITPTIANGRVFVATTNGVAVFGLLPTTTTPPVTTPPVTTPPVVTPPIVTTPVVGPVVPAPTITVGALSSPTIYVGGSANLLAVAGNDVATGASSLVTTWSTLSAPAGAPAPTFTSNGTVGSNVVGVGIGAPGVYVFRATLTAPDGQSVTSDVAVVANLPQPIVVVPAFASASRGAGKAITLTLGTTDQALDPSTLTYTWTTVAAPKRSRAVHFAANGTTAARVTSFTPSRLGVYRFQVRVTNPLGQSTTADLVVNVTKPARVRARR